MATLMHENGADIRFIQEILGHVKLETTQIYTHVSIRALQQVHATTHPAAMLGHGEKPLLRHDKEAVEELSRMMATEAEDDDVKE